MQVMLCDKEGNPDHSVEAIAWYGGLAVTPTWWDHGYEFGDFSITHVASGFSLRNGLTDHQAIRAIAALCERLDVDWTLPVEMLVPNEALKQRARQIIKEIIGNDDKE